LRDFRGEGFRNFIIKKVHQLSIFRYYIILILSKFTAIFIWMKYKKLNS
jgi:hypothetical protein